VLLSITSRTPDATNLGYLLHKNPARLHEVDLSFGMARVFFPVAEPDQCTAVLMVEVDPVGLVRSAGAKQGLWALGQYVNDRPYAASSFLSVAISRAFGTALNGRCAKLPELADTPLLLEAKLPVIQAPNEAVLRELFEPLGYEVECFRLPLEPAFPDWGESRYFDLILRGTLPLHLLLKHLFVLIPALDREKHYWVGPEEIEKLLLKGEGWLAEHPMRAWITDRYLKYQKRLVREALERLAPEPDKDGEEEEAEDSKEPEAEKKISLHEVRLERVVELLAAHTPQSVIDLGCGEGKLLRLLLNKTKIPRVAGMDVSSRALEIANERLERSVAPSKRSRLKLFSGSLIYRDSRLRGYDAAALVEVIEHLDEDRLDSLEEVVFADAAPKLVVVTTPNREYNPLFENLKPGAMRHGDHRFEWTRAEFQQWANRIAVKHGYRVTFEGLGEEDAECGSPSQMAIFQMEAGSKHA
jgi:3' terminal RNA ribose 2'-O-methyltransferase Hen1